MLFSITLTSLIFTISLMALVTITQAIGKIKDIVGIVDMTVFGMIIVTCIIRGWHLTTLMIQVL